MNYTVSDLIKTKIYIKEITDCSQCPSCDIDNNIPRYQCSKMRNQHIRWMSSGDDKMPVPDWCPLPDKENKIIVEKSELLTEKEMEIK